MAAIRQKPDLVFKSGYPRWDTKSKHWVADNNNDDDDDDDDNNNNNNNNNDNNNNNNNNDNNNNNNNNNNNTLIAFPHSGSFMLQVSLIIG